MSASGGRYRGLPADERIVERRERLLEAGLELLGNDGSASTTVRAVCRAARLNPRYFYESFDDLDALVICVFDRIVAETTEQLVAAYEHAPVDARAKARATLEAAICHLTDDPRRARVAFVEAWGGQALTRRRLDTVHELAALVADYADRFYGVTGGRDRIGDVTSMLLVGGIVELMIAWLDGRLAATRAQLIEDVAELFVICGEGAVAIARRRARAGGTHGAA